MKGITQDMTARLEELGRIAPWANADSLRQVSIV